LAGRCIKITLDNHLCRYANRGSSYPGLFAKNWENCSFALAWGG
jgi:hypothetical protein